jgi:tyrosinase
VQTTASLNYSYPEFNGLNMGDVAAGKKQINQTIVDLYWNFPLLPTPRIILTSKDNHWFVSTTVASTANPERTVQSRDWTARIHVEKYALNGSFFIVIFIGPVPSDTSQ